MRALSACLSSALRVSSVCPLVHCFGRFPRRISRSAVFILLGSYPVQGKPRVPANRGKMAARFASRLKPRPLKFLSILCTIRVGTEISWDMVCRGYVYNVRVMLITLIEYTGRLRALREEVCEFNYESKERVFIAKKHAFVFSHADKRSQLSLGIFCTCLDDRLCH